MGLLLSAYRAFSRVAGARWGGMNATTLGLFVLLLALAMGLGIAVSLAWRYRCLLLATSADLSGAREENRHLIRTDLLTGCTRRAMLVDDLSEELLRAQRYGRPLAVALVDLDRFRRLNDTRGLQAGDAVLREVGSALRAASRTRVDRVYRYGDEEFLVVLPETDLQGAQNSAERLRALIERLHVPWGRGHLRISASIVVTELRHSEDEHPEDLLSRADTLLAEAQTAGRSRVLAA